MVETIIAIAVLGIGVASTIGGLTKINAIAGSSRNSTGAYAVLSNQVDLFQSMSPFNPQKTNQNPDPCSGATNTAQIPKDTCHGSYPLYDMTVGSHNLSVDSVSYNVPVYRESTRWTYMNAAARTGATGFASTDVGQLAFQSDNGSYWILQSTTPTWTSTNRGLVEGTLTETVTDLNLAGTTPSSGPFQAVFKVTFTYLGRSYTYYMSTIRTSDI